MNAAIAGIPTTIYLGADIKGDVVFDNADAALITIEGCGHEYDGTITITDNTDIEFVGVNFASESATSFINVVGDGLARLNQHTSLFVDGCSFEGNDATTAAIVANEGSITVKNSTIEGCENGLELDGAKMVKVENTTIEVENDGICVDGSVDGFSLTLKDNEITANQPLVVCNLTGNGEIELSGENTLTTEAEYQIVLTNGACDEKAMPTGTYTLTGADGYTVYDGWVKVAKWDEFTAALAANAEGIKLTGDVVNATSYTINQNVIIDLNGKTFELTNASAILYTGIDKNNTNTPNVTIKNGYINNIVYGLSGDLNLTDIVFGGTVTYLDAAQGVINTKYANLLAVNCKMTNVKKEGSTKPRTISVEGRSSGYIRLIDCNLSKSGVLDRAYFWTIGGTTILELKNCVLFNTLQASNIELSGTYSWTNMDISGCKGGFTFGIGRASTSLTEEELAIYKAIKKNNSGSMRFIFSDGEKNNL